MIIDLEKFFVVGRGGLYSLHLRESSVYLTLSIQAEEFLEQSFFGLKLTGVCLKARLANTVGI